MGVESRESVVVERILERGSWGQLCWLFATYGEAGVAEWVWFSTDVRLLTPEREAIRRALDGIGDAEPQPMPRLLQPVGWADVRAYCEAAARRLARGLSGLGG
jgi:hypothetical protein